MFRGVVAWWQAFYSGGDDGKACKLLIFIQLQGFSEQDRL